jgi:hypothetical protein
MDNGEPAGRVTALRWWGRAFGLGLVVVLSLLSACFGVAMLICALGQLRYHGERWGLLGVLFFGGPGLLVQMAFAALAVLCAIAMARSSTGRRRPVAVAVSIMLLLPAAVGLLANCVALLITLTCA